MNTKFIFLLILAVFLSNSTCSYINEPKVFEQEFGKDKRSLDDYQCSDDYLVTNIKKDLNDDDYRNGNVEPDTDDRETEDLKNLKKRETEVITGNVGGWNMKEKDFDKIYSLAVLSP